jgi:hypothetical protein
MIMVQFKNGPYHGRREALPGEMPAIADFPKVGEAAARQYRIDLAMFNAAALEENPEFVPTEKVSYVFCDTSENRYRAHEGFPLLFYYQGVAE